MKERSRNNGYTLIELLVVMAIIVMMTGIAVPVMIRSGFFSSDKSRTGARDLFAQLRAASLHARTHNVRAAIAYDVELIQDSLFTGTVGTNTVLNVVPGDYRTLYPEIEDSDFDAKRPVLTQTLFVRQLSLNELKESDSANMSLAQRIIDHDENDEYGSFADITADTPYVPANSTYGQFEDLPVETAVLTNHPSILQTAGTQDDFTNFQTETALRSIVILYVANENGVFVVERAYPKDRDINLTDTDFFNRGLPLDLNKPTPELTWNNRFPAHVFAKSGALEYPSASGVQRIQLSVGLKPDANYFDRYMVNEDNNDQIYYFEEFYNAAADTSSPYYENYDLVGIETDVTIYVPTGRVVVEGDDGT